MSFKSDNLLGIILVLSLLVRSLQAHPRVEKGIKTVVFRSPEIVLEPGLVSNKFYYDIDFPRGYVAIKSFDAELVDENDNSIPLHETYLHHWVVFRYYVRKGVSIENIHRDNFGIFESSDRIFIKNSGVCDIGLTQYFGLGSETRKTPTDIPDPYGIEVGNKLDVPEGFEEKWMLNAHTIDTRGAEDRQGCTECRCDLYNVTKELLPENYNGGLRCCHESARCRVKTGFHGVKRSLYLRYKVGYVDWSDSIIPVKVYVLDITDTWRKGDESRGLETRHKCLIEYDVESCRNDMEDDEHCTHTRKLKLSSPINGDVIYAVGHQHAGATGIALYGEGGREICASTPIYGQGFEPGNEAGYIVGMSTCYPPTGSIKISYGETLTLVSNYSNNRPHTGVMGLFYLLVADDSSSAYSNDYLPHNAFRVHESMMKFNFNWATITAVFGLAVVVFCGAAFMLWGGERGRSAQGYEPVVVN